MKKVTYLTLSTALLLLPAVKAQQSPTAFSFRAVVQPGMSIGGHMFTPDTRIESAAFNDGGETAFIGRWTDANTELAAIFTESRIVAKEGDLIGGKRIGAITKECAVWINNAGQVAYSAAYTDDPQDIWMKNARWGIFIERHLAFSAGNAQKPPAFMLNDDGRLVPGYVPDRIDPPSPPEKQTIFGRVEINPPTTIPLTPGDDIPRLSNYGPRPPLPDWVDPFPVRRINWRHQQLITVNFSPQGFVLLIATPVTH